MTKKERRRTQLNAHYDNLHNLAIKCGVVNSDGKKLSTKLLHFETMAHFHATQYCNGEIDTERWTSLEKRYRKNVQELFCNNLQGLKINGDARGYTLKISDVLFKPGGEYQDIHLHRDFGGYGILAPLFDGE